MYCVHPVYGTKPAFARYRALNIVIWKRRSTAGDHSYGREDYLCQPCTVRKVSFRLSERAVGRRTLGKQGSAQAAIDRDVAAAVIEGALSQLLGLVGGATPFEILSADAATGRVVIKLDRV